MIYGYVRVSRRTQNVERQIRNIKAAYPDAVIISEVYTRTSMDRPKWNRLMDMIKPGDLIVFDSASRMSGNAEEGSRIYEKLFNLGVELEFLLAKEKHINTKVYRKALNSNIPLTGGSVDYILEGVNKYLMALAKEQIRLVFEQAEKEVLDNRQRTGEGLVTAKLKGKRLGQRPGARLVTKKSQNAKKVILKHAKDFGGSLKDKEVIALLGIASNTYYKYKKELWSEYEQVDQ